MSGRPRRAAAVAAVRQLWNADDDRESADGKPIFLYFEIHRL